jgi:hypothetical protein
LLCPLGGLATSLSGHFLYPLPALDYSVFQPVGPGGGSGWKWLSLWGGPRCSSPQNSRPCFRFRTQPAAQVLEAPAPLPFPSADAALERLALPAAERTRIESALHQRVPRPTAKELKKHEAEQAAAQKDVYAMMAKMGIRP